MAERSPVFIVGRMRSGTTLLRQMLNAHPQIYLTFENDVFFYHWVYRNITDPFEWLERYAEEVSFKLMEIDVKSIRDSLPHDLQMGDIHLLFLAIMREKCRAQGKTRFGDKTPNLWKNLGFIFKYFEDPKVIHIVRDPRDVVNSLERVPWGMGSRLCSNFYCRLEMSQVARYRSRILEIKMEDLIAEPRKSLESVLDYIGEPWDDRVLEYQKHAPRDANHDWPGLSSATKALDRTKRHGRHSNALGPVWNRLVEKHNRENMAWYGYRPFELEREPTAAEYVREIVKDVPGACRYFYKLGRLFTLIRCADVSAQAKVENVFDLNPKGWKYHPGRVTPVVK